MKLNKTTIWYLVILIVVAAVYRITPLREYGFAPHIAMALFGGAVIKDRKWAFALPLFSMFVSDLLYEVLYQNGLSSMKGLYSGQWLNYLALASVVVVGFFMRKISPVNIFVYSLIAPTWFFLVSNFTVWAGSKTIAQTWEGLMQTYTLGIPFYRQSILATILFSAVFFGAWYILDRRKPVVVA
jgi:hypothetical protein